MVSPANKKRQGENLLLLSGNDCRENSSIPLAFNGGTSDKPHYRTFPGFVNGLIPLFTDLIPLPIAVKQEDVSIILLTR